MTRVCSNGRKGPKKQGRKRYGTVGPKMVNETLGRRTDSESHDKERFVIQWKGSWERWY